MLKYLFSIFIIVCVFSKNIVEGCLLMDETETVEVFDFDSETEKGEEKLELKDQFFNHYSLEYPSKEFCKIKNYFTLTIKTKYPSCREVLTPPPDQFLS